MILKVHPHTIEIEKNPVNEREVNISKCEFVFDEEITNDLVKEAYFTFGDSTYKVIIENDECNIPSEVLTKKGTIEIGVVAFKVNGDELVKRYNPSPAYFNSWDGSLKDNAENSEPITPSEMEQFEQELQNGLAEVNSKLPLINQAITEANNLNIDISKVDKVATIDLTKKDGTQKQVQIRDGYDFQYDWDETKLGVKTDAESEYNYVDLKGEKGDCYFATFEIVNGRLKMNKPENLDQIDFRLSPNGHLEMEVSI
jgi:hypothetical protein